jgi:hypothetical protein
MARPGLKLVGPALLMTAFGTVCGGCGPYARVEMYQPRQDGSEQLLELESPWAEFAVGASEGDRLLLAWPLPGSRFGPKQYLLYLRFPAGGGEFGAGSDAGAAGEAAGFLIQRAGRLAGLTAVTRGRLAITGAPKTRTGQLYLKCADGTEIRGAFRAARSDLAVQFFEDDHRADVTSLTASDKSARPDAQEQAGQ